MNILALFFIKQCIMRSLVHIREDISTITNMIVWVYRNCRIFIKMDLKYFSAFNTLVTFIWCFTSVYPQMQFQIKFMWELHLYVFSPVCVIRCGLKLSFHKKSFITLVVFIWFFSSVCLQMWLKATISQKRFIRLVNLYGFSPVRWS